MEMGGRGGGGGDKKEVSWADAGEDQRSSRNGSWREWRGDVEVESRIEWREGWRVLVETSRRVAVDWKKKKKKKKKEERERLGGGGGKREGERKTTVGAAEEGEGNGM
jgi:hypothetical protein